MCQNLHFHCSFIRMGPVTKHQLGVVHACSQFPYPSPSLFQQSRTSLQNTVQSDCSFKRMLHRVRYFKNHYLCYFLPLELFISLTGKKKPLKNCQTWQRCFKFSIKKLTVICSLSKYRNSIPASLVTIFSENNYSSVGCFLKKWLQTVVNVTSLSQRLVKTCVSSCIFKY